MGAALPLVDGAVSHPIAGLVSGTDGRSVLAAFANARSWLQISADAMSEHRALVRDALPEGLSPMNEARRSVQLAHLARTARDARNQVTETLGSIGNAELPPEHARTREAIELAGAEIDAYLCRLPIPPI